MQTTTKPHLHSLSHHGYIQGLTISASSTNTPLCHFFGNLRYGLPAQRWRRASVLPVDYSYGTREEPGKCEKGAGVCPQPAFLGPVDRSGWSEDCFQVNVWVPVGDGPEGGWPVLFYIHGGWLQFGSPNGFSGAGILGDSPVNAIIVMPAYRLNVFGFLYSSELEHDAASVGETTGNHGFWDQRLALEWTRDNIGLFGGNKKNITVAGYSAGAYSTFHQLTYDLSLPPQQSIIKRACIWSNSPAAQPKHPPEAQSQFNALLTTLNISPTLPDSEKLARLRALDPDTLLNAATSTQFHQYRPTSDGAFVSQDLFKSLANGEFARRFRERGIKVLLGETRDEPNLYALWSPPEDNTLDALRTRLIAEYPTSTVDALLPLYYPDNKLPPGQENWDSDAFGRIYADMQVYKMQRGLIHSLVSHGVPDSSIYRYRVEMRVKCAEKQIPIEWGVTHATDHFIWFWGNGEVLEEREKGAVGRALIGPLARFLDGERDIGWGTSSHRQMRVLKGDGEVGIWEDEFWNEAMRVWGAVPEIRDGRENARL
ncbi:putative carboxylesterase [Aspergillus glaucus CBS 516.65]|uniref:Carboxylic ester hydrolase n=1 Tax=Aspergillus glaucus CBS 516.65 TaxID=1160497 RepID=A0A1L9VJ01_ASPGL|nr:hypothetical protein ASPGLDRAFT_82574 [Aspergillus glaucus CBS 516.65]OJJ83901.1 hypothetical protein ASPGLDRAFT_82574 [Aspergillus glaucus CBS 516.65]